jgi:hypothetical protein
MLHPHGYPSSYFVTPFFAGANVMALFGYRAPDGSSLPGPHDPTVVPVLIEAGSHHPTPKPELARHYVFADLHSALGLPYSPDAFWPR